MRVAVVLDDNITLEMFNENLPTQSQYFVCNLKAGIQLQKYLQGLQIEDLLVKLRGPGAGWRVKGCDGIAIGEYSFKGVTYSIWGPGTSQIAVSHVNENSEKINDAIVAAINKYYPVEGRVVRQNVDGVDMKMGSDGVTPYCGRELGKTIFRLKDNDGFCGPLEGFNCPACNISQGIDMNPRALIISQLKKEVNTWIRKKGSTLSCDVNNAGMHPAAAANRIFGVILECMTLEDKPLVLYGSYTFEHKRTTVLYLKFLDDWVTVNISPSLGLTHLEILAGKVQRKQWEPKYGGF